VRAFLFIIAILLFAAVAAGQEVVSFPTDDGGLIYALEYGAGDRGVVLAHGGRFHVLAIDFRGRGQSTGPSDSNMMSAPLYLDVLAAVRYLHKAGAKSVSVVGGSMGGWAGAEAMARCEPGEIERIVLLGSTANDKPELLKGRKLFILCRDDTSGDGPRLPRIQADYEKTPEPKELILLDGSAHAQFIFESDQNERAMKEILRFLTKD
jgi:pimeloyl-ACP methyl ester carboxylesterase